MLLNSLIRVSQSPSIIAKNFSTFTKQKHIISKGIKIGTTARGLRGVMATRALNPGENLIACPSSAMLSFVDAYKDEEFFAMFSPSSSSSQKQNHWREASPLITPQNFHDKLQGTFVHLSHFTLALYMAHLMLRIGGGGERQSTGIDDITSNSSSNNSHQNLEDQWIHYLNFLPRNETNFPQMVPVLESVLSQHLLAQDCFHVLSKQHHVEIQQELMPLVIWCLCMIFSRSIPIDHLRTVERILEKTPFLASCSSKLSLTGGGEDTQQVSSTSKALSQYPIPCLCPVLDLINHHRIENAAVMVPDTDLYQTRCVVVRTTKPIAVGEEVVTCYGAGRAQDLSLLYGIVED